MKVRFLPSEPFETVFHYLMVLPWLDKEKTVSMLMRKRGEAGAVPAKDTLTNSPLHSAMEDFHKAHADGSISGMADAFRTAFNHLDSEPHEEGPHINEG